MILLQEQKQRRAWDEKTAPKIRSQKTQIIIHIILSLVLRDLWIICTMESYTRVSIPGIPRLLRLLALSGYGTPQPQHLRVSAAVFIVFFHVLPMKYGKQMVKQGYWDSLC
jgi:hypothetical protein